MKVIICISIRIKLWKKNGFKHLSNKQIEILNLCTDKIKNINICFSCLYENKKESLNMTLIRGKKYILISSGWAELLVFNKIKNKQGIEIKLNQEEIHNAYCMTLGHELGHCQIEPLSSHYLGNDNKFIKWCREIHADYYGCQKMFEGNYQKAIRAIKFKMSISNYKENDTHPSWDNRIKYLKNKRFDGNLIQTIANDIGNVGKHAIDYIIDFYYSHNGIIILN